jgi:hypothetical protein
LVRLTALQTSFAADVARLGRYLPALTSEQQQVNDVASRLQATLARNGSPDMKAAAVASFAAVAERSAGALESATAPGALRPIRQQEVDRSRNLAAIARQLWSALVEHRRADAEKLVQRLGIVAAGPGSSAEKDAVVACDLELKGINEQSIAVVQERSRLDSELP